MSSIFRNFYLSISLIWFLQTHHIFFLITETKRNISQQIIEPDKQLCFVTLFENKEQFKEKSNSISWDSFVWLASDPKHTIHYDTKPKLTPRYS